jgi:hypothetical protein
VFWYHGWFQSGVAIVGKPVKAIILCLAVFAVMALFCWYSRTEPSVGSEARVYLSSAFGGLISLDEQMDKITLAVLTTNVGHLDALPHAWIFYYVRFRKPLSKAEEDSLFGTVNVGGGQAALTFTNDNYWTPGETKRQTVSGEIEFETLVDVPNEKKEWESFVGKDPRDKMLAYVFARHVAQDKLGTMVTESCFYLTGPDFQPTECLGHNGPSIYPK